MIQPAANKPLTIIKLMAYWLLFLLFSCAWYTQYYQWTDCFNALGRCFNPNEDVVYTDDAFVWAIPAVLFLGLGIMPLFNLLKKD